MEVRRGACRAHVALPDKLDGRGVLVLHEAFGLNEDIPRIAKRFAEQGYVAVAPAAEDAWARIFAFFFKQMA